MKKVVKKPVKKIVKKVVKKPVKKVVKKVVKKPAPKPAKRIVKKPAGRAAFRGKQGAVGRGAGRGAGASGNQLAGKYVNTVKEIGIFGFGAVKDFGGGNGAAIFSSPVLIGGGLWVLVLLRYVLFYGLFGDD